MPSGRDRRARRPGRARPHAGHGRNGLRVHRRHGALRRGRGRHAVLPVRVLDLLLRPAGQSDRLHPLFDGGDEPYRHHRRPGADRVLHRRRHWRQEHGVHFFKLFVPPGVPIYILPLVVAIEIVSFLSRPVSHSVRLFANMLAGHITLNVFGSFVVMLLGAGAAVKALALLPFVATIGLDALELLGRVPAGLCVRHADLHVPQRRASPRSLTPQPRNDFSPA